MSVETKFYGSNLMKRKIINPPKCDTSITNYFIHKKIHFLLTIKQYIFH